MSTALYRRYRPDTFADVIGQEHVTVPLMRALDSGRINHAYLFSGPRGCGKTTSARILARCLNCEQGPTGTPCGECDSCVALARGGPGSIDVIEIDAASHGGVDDARELRERAAFAPAESRYKVYIIDEAHMVTTQGFNALLKIVEEPPEHVKFVFATTEPEKVIGTIRSRTHHYPFRLVPPARLHDYLELLCRAEGVDVEPGVLSFVVRAGGGSVRDSLSVLDQLMAGSDARGLTYDGAAALLGFTDGELLDATVTAFGAGDAAGVFTQIDKVIETGHDPRRFIEDLLERFRDLIVLTAVPDAGSSVLRALPSDQIERMRVQAGGFGPGALSHAADLVNTGLSEMTGATAPRLQLELIAARVLLPGAAGEHGYAARLDRIERRLDVVGAPSPRATQPLGEAQPPRATQPLGEAEPPGEAQPPQQPGEIQPRGEAQPKGEAQPRGEAQPQQPGPNPPAAPQPDGGARQSDPPPPGPAASQPGTAPLTQAANAAAPSVSGPSGGRLDAGPDGEQPQQARGGGQPQQRPAGPRPRIRMGSPEPSAPAPGPDAAASAGGGRGPGGLDLEALRRSWPDVLARIFTLKRTTWTFLSEHAQVDSYDGQRLVLSIGTVGLANTFRSGIHPEIVRQALIDVLGLDARVDAIARTGGAGGPGGGDGPGDGRRDGRGGGPGTSNGGARNGSDVLGPQGDYSRQWQSTRDEQPVASGSPGPGAPAGSNGPDRAAESSHREHGGPERASVAGGRRTQPGGPPDPGADPAMRRDWSEGGPAWGSGPASGAPSWASGGAGPAASTSDSAVPDSAALASAASVSVAPGSAAPDSAAPYSAASAHSAAGAAVPTERMSPQSSPGRSSPTTASPEPEPAGAAANASANASADPSAWTPTTSYPTTSYPSTAYPSTADPATMAPATTDPATMDPTAGLSDEDLVSADDEDLMDLGEVGQPVVERVLGGTVIWREDESS
ncbi:MAG: DNA polymerase III subunit gamma and tau [Actinobacteria bacterium]|nr:DNA polymerase III subunit gamma and tau [Actinomycetota bacterium]